MNYNIDYGYTTYLAFLLNLKYNNSRTLSIKSLVVYPKYLLELLLDLKNDNIYIRMINENDNFVNFIIKNKEIFTITKNNIVLNKNVSISDLYMILYMYDYPFTDLAINIMKSNDSIKNILKLKGITNALNKYDVIEKELEKMYIKDDINTYEIIRYLQNERDIFYHNLIKLGSEKISDFEDESNFMCIDPYDENNYPIDSENNYELLTGDDIDSILLSPYLIAYFTNAQLSMFRINEDISNISLKYCCFSEYLNDKEFVNNIENDLINNMDEDFNTSITFRSNIETFFILTLINNLGELVSNELDEFAIESIEQTKRRLLYMIDNNKLNLYNPINYNKVYNKYLNDYNNGKFNTDDFEEISFNIIDKYGIVAKTLIYDIFKGVDAGLNNDELNIKKLAFIKTYYWITKDKEILSILSKYSDNNNFWKYNNYFRKNNLKLERRINNE